MTEKLLHKHQVVLGNNTATFGNTQVDYFDIQDVVFNTDTRQGDEIAAAAVIRTRPRMGYSPVSGLDNFQVLNFVFASDAMVNALAFTQHLTDMKIPVRQTQLGHDTFRSAFLPKGFK